MKLWLLVTLLLPGFLTAAPVMVAPKPVVLAPANGPYTVDNKMAANFTIDNTIAPTVSVATPAAPPAWAQDLIVTLEKLPLVGSLVTKMLVYFGILASIMTTLTGASLAILNALMGIFNATGLVEAAAAVVKFRDGPIMYWMKFFSLFNAKKTEPTPPVVGS